MSSSRTDTPRRRVRRVRRGVRWRARHTLGTAVGSLAIFVIALSGVGGSYALWNDSVTVDGGSVHAGTAALTADWASGHSDAVWSQLLPGESARQPLTITNTGDAPLALSATVAVAAGFEVRTSVGACPATALGGAAHTGTARALGVSLAAAASTMICIEVRATASAVPGQTASFSVQFDGTQVPR